MITLPVNLIEKLVTSPETGMGYHIVTVLLKDGRRFDQAVVDSGYVTKVHGHREIPFTIEEIQDVVITHDKWNFQDPASE